MRTALMSAAPPPAAYFAQDAPEDTAELDADKDPDAAGVPRPAYALQCTNRAQSAGG